MPANNTSSQMVQKKPTTAPMGVRAVSAENKIPDKKPVLPTSQRAPIIQQVKDSMTPANMPKYDPQTGSLTDYGRSTNATPTAQPTQPVQPAPVQQAPVDTSNPGLIRSLVEKSLKPSQQYTDLSTEAADAYKQAANFGQAVNQARTDVERNRNYSIDTGVGLSGAIGASQGNKMQQLNAAAQGLGTLASLANTQQGMQQSGIGSAINATAPNILSGGSYMVSPVTGEAVGGGSAQDAAIKGAQFGANVQSVGDAQNKINSIDSVTPALEADVSTLLDFATKGGLSKDLPIMSSVQQAFGTSFASNPAVAGFLAKIETVNKAYENLTGVSNIIDPQRTTVSQLDTVQRTLRQGVANSRQAAQDLINSKASSKSSKKEIGWDDLLSN